MAGAGCGSSTPKRIMPPALDVQAVTKAVMAAADANCTGGLDRAEVARVSGLTSAFGTLDADPSESLSTAGITIWGGGQHGVSKKTMLVMLT